MKVQKSNVPVWDHASEVLESLDDECDLTSKFDRKPLVVRGTIDDERSLSHSDSMRPATFADCRLSRISEAPNGGTEMLSERFPKLLDGIALKEGVHGR